MLTVHRATDATALVEALAALLREPLDDPFATEWVTVPTTGVGRWVEQRLARRLGTRPGGADGISANVRLAFPGRLVATALAPSRALVTTGAPAAALPDDEPWDVDRVAWAVLSVTAEHADDARFGPAARTGEGIDRWSRARRVADLFDRYAAHRPEMLARWATAGGDEDAGRLLPEGAEWQLHLWRAVRELLGPSPAEALEARLATLRDDPAAVELPARVSVFGVGNLPAGHVRVLDALAAHRDVHLFVPHPSPALWTAVDELLGGAPARLPARDADPTADLPRHPLLATWGRPAREAQVVLRTLGADARDALHDAPLPAPDTLLHRLQRAVLADEPPAPAPLASDDRSVQVHSCFGPARQVEVLRDALLHLFAEDPTLEPRDVLVLTPAIDRYEALVDAVLGAGTHATGSLPTPRVVVTDRSLGHANPLLEALVTVVEVVSGRFGAAAITDLAALGPVRERLGLDDAATDLLHRWVEALGVRWGIDGAHRERWGLPADLPDATWSVALDRLLVSVALTTGPERCWDGGIVPVDVEGAEEVRAAGIVAELLTRLRHLHATLTRTQPTTAWVDALAEAADLLLAPDPDDARRRDELDAVLADVARAAQLPTGSVGVALSPIELRSALGRAVSGAAARTNHGSGAVTVTSLTPMRGVPARVVCLLGLDDDVLRASTADGDDLLARDPVVGDRDARAETRQLLLDAVLAAGDHLVITTTGRDVATSQAVPPAVALAELLDALLAGTEDAERARARLVTEHPRQSYGLTAFTPGALGCEGAWSFDGAALEAARIRAAAKPLRPLVGAPVPLPDDHARTAVDLADMRAFVRDPLRHFVQRRLDASLPDRAGGGSADDDLPVELDGLAEHGLTEALLARRARGHDAGWEAVARAASLVPPRAFGTSALDAVRAHVDALEAQASAAGVPLVGTERADVDLVLPDHRPLRGVVDGLHGSCGLTVSWTRLAPKHLAAAWVDLLARLAGGDRDAHAVLVMRLPSGERKQPVVVVRLDPPDPDPELARTTLGRLAELRDRALREPLPLFSRASAVPAFASGRWVGALRQVWENDRVGESQDRFVTFALGAGITVDDLLADPPREDEQGGWWVSGASRFEVLARTFWQPFRAAFPEVKV